MKQKLKNIIENHQDILQIHKQNFSDERIFDKKLDSSSLMKLSLLNCNFDTVDFGGSFISECEFNTCTFNHTRFLKAEFENCTFTNSTIIDCSLDKVSFDETNFTSCQFKKISLLRAYFHCCQFMETNFDEISLNGAVVIDSKFYQFNRCIDLKGDFSFEQILKVLNSIPSKKYFNIKNEVWENIRK